MPGVAISVASRPWSSCRRRRRRSPRAPVPATTCEVFPADNVWNMDVSRLPKHPKSKVWKRRACGLDRPAPRLRTAVVRHPVRRGRRDPPRRDVDFDYATRATPARTRSGPTSPIEGGSDRHALMVDADTCTLYELFDARWNGGEPRAGSGAIFDLGSNALRPAGWTSADAAGLPIFPGLVRWDEVQAGEIDHAIRFTVACTTRRYVWPARHQAGRADRRCPPMGARFRLKGGLRHLGVRRRTRRSCCSRCSATA